MKPIRFIHAADFHLDSPLTGSSMDSRQRRQRQRELIETFASILDKAISLRADFLIIAGDLFEHRTVRKSTIEEIARQFTRISHIPVFITPGNHDPYLVNSYYQTFLWPENVHIFRGGFHKITLKELEVDVYGYGYDSYNLQDNPLKTLKIEDSGYRKIVIYHGSHVPGKGLQQSPSDFTREDIASLPVDYVALGHYHQYQEVGDPSHSPRCLYSGCPEPVGFDEQGSKGILWVQMEHDHAEVSFLNTQKRRYHDMTVDITSCSSPFEVHNLLNQVKLPGNSEMDYYLLQLTGVASRKLHLDMEALNQWFSKERYRGMIVDETQDEYDFDSLRGDQGLVGMFVRKMEDMIHQEQSEKRRRVLRHALVYGLDALLDGDVREE